MTKTKKQNLQNMENNSEKTVDIKNGNVNAIANEAQKKPTVANDEEFTISPDGLYKIPKPKSHGFDFELGGMNIDYFDRPGYQIAWFKDDKPHELTDAIRMGYEFVDSNCPEAFGRELKKHGGYRKDGTAYHLYAMQIPIEVFKKRKAMEHQQLHDHEIGQGLYATKDLKLGTGYQHGYLSKE